MLGIEYICVAAFSARVPDIQSWEMRLLEFGLHREAFSVTISPTGNLLVKFWEPDRTEAIRILARLDDLDMAAA